MTPLECVQALAECPRDPGRHGPLDDLYIDRCIKFRGDETAAVAFLRNLIDEIVRYAGGTDWVVRMIQIVLSPFPENEEAKEARRTHYEKSGRWP